MTDIVEKTAEQIAEEQLMELATRASFRHGVGIDSISKEGAQAMNEQVQTLTNKIAHETLRKAFMAGYLARIEEEGNDTDA